MFNLAPVGRFHVQVCGTTPCMLRGSDDVLAACKNKGLIKGKTTPDGLFTLTEVECMGNCASAPMVQINDDNYEDLDYDRTVAILDALARGEQPGVAGPADGHGRDRHPGRHLHDGEQGVHAVEVLQRHRHADHGQRGEGGEHAGQVGRAARAGHDHADAATDSSDTPAL